MEGLIKTTGQQSVFDYGSLDVVTRVVVQQEDKEFDRNMEDSGTSFIRACHNLLRIHEVLRYKRPGFVDYCRAKPGCSDSTAYKMLDVARMFPESGNISIASREALYLLAAPSTPEPVRLEAVRQAESGVPITHAIAKELIAQGRERDGLFVQSVHDAVLDGKVRPLTATTIIEIVRQDPNALEDYVNGIASSDDLVGEDSTPSESPSDQEENLSFREESPAAQPEPMAVHYSSDTPEWYTPQKIIDRVLAMFQVIDLDPCSNSHEAPNVPAEHHYTKEDDGLAQPWFGYVYMNPPYGDQIGAWVEKLVTEYEQRDGDAGVALAIALLPARVDTAWWRRLSAYPVCFLSGRLKFSGADNSAPFPSAVVYLGDNLADFVHAFGDIGIVYQSVQTVER